MTGNKVTDKDWFSDYTENEISNIAKNLLYKISKEDTSVIKLLKIPGQSKFGIPVLPRTLVTKIQQDPGKKSLNILLNTVEATKTGRIKKKWLKDILKTLNELKTEIVNKIEKKEKVVQKKPFVPLVWPEDIIKQLQEPIMAKLALAYVKSAVESYQEYLDYIKDPISNSNAFFNLIMKLHTRPKFTTELNSIHDILTKSITNKMRREQEQKIKDLLERDHESKESPQG